ncbi:MAG: nucleotidyltransferase family protein [Prevotella sp.]|nr:nucleotidyltransferase family protein [Prevotella sp.]
MSNWSKEERLFLALYRYGLWRDPLPLDLFEGQVRWDAVIGLARSQTVVGILTEGIEALPKPLRPEKPVYFGLIANTSDIESKNKRMNEFIPLLMSQLEGKGVHSVLLKGQGVAACYPNPLHRMPGDIDLYIPDEAEYEKARGLMLQIGKEAEEENPEIKHSAFEAYGFLIELHGSFRFFISRRCRNHTDLWRDLAMPAGLGSCRTWSKFTVPPVRFDVIFIFGHLLGQFMGGGIGLRQVSDWMVFIRANKVIDHVGDGVLKSDLDLLGLTGYWQAFASMAVCLLGFPKEEMPFYDPAFDRKGRRVLQNIFYTGNFGARQKAHHLSADTNAIAKKAVTLFGQLPVYWRNFWLFPRDTAYCFHQYLWGSISGLV